MPEQFMARDVYPTWKRNLQGAEVSAWALTPYLDHSLVRLLSNAPERIETIVVTDLSPESGPANYRKKLIALKKLIEHEVDVRSLPRLHAKVLVVDGDTVVAGSQNFTSYARSSKEVSAVSEREQKRALATIARWVAEAKPVTLELIDRLLDATEKQAMVVDKAIKELQDRVLGSVAEFERARAEKARQEAERVRQEAEQKESFDKAARALKNRVSKTPWRLAMGAAYLVSDTATTYSEWYGEDEYPTMYGTNSWGERSGANMTRWFRGQGEARQTLNLEHLYFYPVIHLPAGRMVFARIAQTRITYVKHGVRFTNPHTIGGQARYLGLALPQKLSDGANMIVKVRPWADSTAEHQIGIQFDGENYEVEWEKAATGPWASQAEEAARIVLSELAAPQRGAQLIQRLFEPIKFTELGRDNKNAAAFFGHKKHELKLIDYGSARVFVAVKL